MIDNEKYYTPRWIYNMKSDFWMAAADHPNGLQHLSDLESGNHWKKIFAKTWDIHAQRIHGAGIYANIDWGYIDVYWWDPCYHI